MKLAIALVGLGMAADLATFALVVPHVGIAAEVNPVMQRGYAQVGLLAVVALKLACTAAILLLVLRVQDPLRRWLAVFLGAGMGLLGAWGNIGAGLA